MSVSKEYYKDLSPEELLQDDFFIESITKPNEKSQRFWNDFLSEYPHRTAVVEEAAAFVRMMKFEPDLPVKGVKERIWENVIEAPASSAPVVNIDRKSDV